jgi:hypothetical protein
MLVVVCDAHFLISRMSLQFNDLHEYDVSMTGAWADAASIDAPVDVPTRMDARFGHE